MVATIQSTPYLLVTGVIPVPAGVRTFLCQLNYLEVHLGYLRGQDQEAVRQVFGKMYQ